MMRTKAYTWNRAAFCAAACALLLALLLGACGSTAPAPTEAPAPAPTETPAPPLPSPAPEEARPEENAPLPPGLWVILGALALLAIPVLRHALLFRRKKARSR